MGRPIDTVKMERLEKAVISSVVMYGVAGVTINHISEASKISPGYLYRHYENKDELIEKVIYDTIREFTSSLYDDVNASTSIEEIITSLTSKIFLKQEENQEFSKLFVKLYFDPVFDLEKIIFSVNKFDVLDTLLESKLTTLSKKIFLKVLMSNIVMCLHLRLENEVNFSAEKMSRYIYLNMVDIMKE